MLFVKQIINQNRCWNKLVTNTTISKITRDASSGKVDSFVQKWGTSVTITWSGFDKNKRKISWF